MFNEQNTTEREKGRKRGRERERARERGGGEKEKMNTCYLKYNYNNDAQRCIYIYFFIRFIYSLKICLFSQHPLRFLQMYYFQSADFGGLYF